MWSVYVNTENISCDMWSEYKPDVILSVYLNTEMIYYELHIRILPFLLFQKSSIFGHLKIK